MCEVIGVNRSSYYKWRGATASRQTREAADEKPARRVRAVHDASDSAYGSPRITAGLRDRGERVNHKHVARVMRKFGTDGMRLTCFATNTTHAPIAALELRHRQRPRAEDRIRAARDTGLRNLPLHDGAQNQVWLETVQLGLDLLARMPMLALTGDARRWEPERLRLRLFSAAAQLVTTGRRRWLRLARHWLWTETITSAFERLKALPNSG